MLATGLKMGAGVLVLPLALRMLPMEQMDLWFVLVTIGNLVLLLDGGLGPTVMRSISYVVAGVVQLRGDGIEELPSSGGRVNQNYLKTICDTLNRAYKAMGVAIGGLLLIGGGSLAFLRWEGATVLRIETWVWIIYVIGVVLTLQAGLWIALCSGLNHVRDAQRSIVVGQGTFLLVAWIGIYAGFGLIALATAYVCGAFITYRLARNVSLRYLNEMGISLGHTFDRQILAAVWPTAWRGISVGLGGFLIVNANTLICFYLLPPGSTSSYGLTLQASTILGSLSVIWLAVKLPTINRLRAQGEIDAVAQLFVGAVKKSLGSYLLGAVVVLSVGQGLLDVIGSKVDLLPQFETSLLLIIGFLEMHHILYSNLVQSENRNPFLLPSIVSGVIIVAVSVQVAPIAGVIGMIVVRGAVQAAFNNWWTVLRGIRGLGYTVSGWFPLFTFDYSGGKVAK